LATLIALPMSWHRAATTTSSSAPARSANVAVCRQWVSWSVTKPSSMSANDSSIASTRVATRGWFSAVCRPISIHSSRLETSIEVKVALGMRPG
jgi:hypothetical protein